MKIERIYAVPHKKQGYCIDARNPFGWEEVGKIVLDENVDKATIEAAYIAHNIPPEAVVVSIRMLEG